MGIFSQFSDRTHGKYVCDPRYSIPELQERRRGKGQRELEKGKEEG